MKTPESEVELTVLLLTLDESAALKRILGPLRAAASACSPRHEILVVDGGSRDGTVETARDAGARVVIQDRRGYGNAHRLGLAEARGRWIACLDADGSHPVDLLPRLWAAREDCDVAMGSRYLPQSSDPRPWLRRSLSRILNKTFAAVLRSPLTDFSGALRLYRAEAVRDIETTAENFDVLAEQLIELERRGCRILEFPYRYNPRIGGQSKARLLTFSACYARTLWRNRSARA